ncbi:MAG TPA: hypothetical protein PKI66_02910 [Methanobacteriaceae archaeon]|nr:hypothetical protein [Methanobacteriaceae archaeon]
MKTSSTNHQGHSVSNCQVTHEDHREGIRDLRRRHTEFYQILTRCIENKEQD